MYLSNLFTVNSAFLLAVAVISYCASVVVYRLWFHPLAKFPGPKIAAASRFYEFYYDALSHGRYWKKIEEMHQRYGPIVRINPHELHINDSEFYEKLYNFSPDLDKDPLHTRELGMTHNIEGTTEFSLHKRRKAAFGVYFSRMQITRLEGLIHLYANKLCDAIREQKFEGAPVSMSLLYRCFTGEIVCEYCFSKSYGFFEDLEKARGLLVDLTRPGDFPGVWYHLGRFTDYVGAVVFVQIFFHKIRVMLGASDVGSFAEFFDYANNMIASVTSAKTMPDSKFHQSEKDDHPTVFHKIIESDLPPEDKDASALFENTVLFLNAGYETTGYTLTLATYHVLSNPSIKARLRQEVKAAWPDVDEFPSWAELEKLPLLDAVIKESLRLFCGVLSRLPRVNNRHVIQYGKWDIPPGTPVSMSHHAIHHDPNIFPNPAKFDPDRWLRAEDPKKLEKYLVSFSRGSRGCIGKELAMAELCIALATVFRRFDLELADGASVEDIEPYHDEFISVPRTGKQKLFVKVQ